MADTNSKLPFLEIIEWVETNPNLLMWKVPDQDKEIKNGAKLIVRESQTVLFLNEGVLADVFTAGTHTLSTNNIPILSKLKGEKFGFRIFKTHELDALRRNGDSQVRLTKCS